MVSYKHTTIPFKSASIIQGESDSGQIRKQSKRSRQFPDVVSCTNGNRLMQQHSENIFTIPNLLCVLRIASSPLLGYLIVQRKFHLAMTLSILAALTDFLDGYIARRFPSQASVLGSYLDPLADKISITTLFFTLYLVELISGYLTTLVISRDIFLFLAGVYVRFESLDHPRTLKKFFQLSRSTAQLSPLYISKVNTALQFLLVSVVLLSTVTTIDLSNILATLSWSVGGTTMVSGIMYVGTMAKGTHRKIRAKEKSTLD